MAKRFLVKNGSKSAIFTVDDQDAFLLRSYKWSLGFGKTNRPFLQRTIAPGVAEVITRVIAAPKSDEVVSFSDGDPTNLQRANLLKIKKSDSVAKATALAMAARQRERGTCAPQP